MFRQNPLQVFLFWTAFLFLDVVDSCERPAWMRVGWDMTLQDLMQLSEEQSNGIHNSVCQICREFTGMGLSKGCLRVLEASCKVALCIVVILSFLYLVPKLKITRRKRTIQAPVLAAAIEMTTERPPNAEKMLFRLVANTSKMMKYMRHVAHHCRKEVRHHKLSKRKKVEDMDDEQYFPICSQCHSSSGDTAMHRI